MFTRFFYYIFCSFFSVCLWAQYANLKFENYSTLEGLSSSTCTDIFQDSDGFLWLGTIDGLNKYDGYKFVAFRPIKNDPRSISSNRITSITEDQFGRLWVGTMNGLNVMERGSDKFLRFRFDPSPTGSSGVETINDLLYDSLSNSIWVATNDGIRRIASSEDLETTDINKYLHDPISPNSIDDQRVLSVMMGAEGDIWAGTNGQQLNLYRPDTDDFLRVHIQTAENYALNHIPKSFLLDRDGNFLIGNDLSNMIFWDRSSNTFQKIQIGDRKQIPIFHIYEDSRSHIWVSTDGHGIYVLNKNKKLIQHITHNPTDPNSIANDQPSYVLEGQSGIFWIATYNKGICKLALSKSVFAHVFYQPGNGNSLSAPIAQSVIQDQKGNIWIGTDGGGLNLYKEGSRKIQHYRHKPNDPATLSSDKIVYLHESHNGSIWVCSWDGGLSLFNPRTGRADRFLHNPEDPYSLGQNTVWCATEDARGWLWLGTQTAGLNVYDPQSGKFYHFTKESTSNPGLRSNLVFSLFIDSQERLLVGTGSGLQVVALSALNQLSDSTALSFVEADQSEIHGLRVNHMAEGQDGSIWVGTDLGLYQLDQDFKLLKSYTTADGLPNNLIVGVVADLEGKIWLTTKSGLSRLDPATDQFKNFNVHDGIQGMEFQSKSIFKTNDGRILTGGINGLNVFRPGEVQFEEQPVHPKITQVKIFNTTINVGDTLNNRVILNKAIDRVDQIVLKHDEGFVTFEFVALHLFNPERVQYAQRMLGVSDNWVYIDELRNASYSNLIAGDYQFEVKAALDGNWTDAAVSVIDIKVLPPPWKTWWAYCLYVITATIIAWGAIRYYNKMINEEREHELDQMKLRFFMNVSHEFRTPLTLILNPVDKIISAYSDPEIVKNSAYTIQRSARKLLNLVNQLLDFRKLDLGKAPLDPLKADLVKFTKDIYAFYEELASSRSIQFVFSCSVDSFYMWFDPDKLEKIIGNLLSNAIKFTNAGGKVELSLSRYKKKQIKDQLMGKNDKLEYIEIVVTDTGVGLKKDQLNAVFERFFHVDNTQTGTGIGLNFTKSLVEQHDGEITVESEYGKGSRFIVRLPVYSKKVDEAIKSNKEVRSTGKEFDLNSIRSLEYDLAITDDFTNDDEEISSVRQTVLIVEDNRELRIHLKNELGARYRIKDAANGKEGLDKALKFYPDIIISDVMMPEMDGFEMCHSLKSNTETSHIPIILLTARSLEEDRMEGYSMGADAYLPKPFNVSVLKVRINNLLESRRKLKEKFLKQTNILPSSEITTNTLDEQFLDKATKAILDNMSDSAFGLDQLLQTVGVSRSHFYRKIQSLTGQNPSNFIRTVRLKYAAELLKQNTSSIKEVAYRSGFNSTAYFSKTFRELFEVTPNEFIQDHRND